MRPLLTATATALALGALGTAEAPAATPLTLGVHNVTEPSYFYGRPGVAFQGTLYASDLFDVTRVSPTGRWAQGYAWGERSRKVWVATAVLSRRAPRAPRGTTEVAGPAGSRVFRPTAELECQGTNFLTVGVRLRGARSARVSVLRAGKVVARSRALAGAGLLADQVRVPCDGAARVRYTVDGRSRDFAVVVGKQRTTD